MPIVPGHARATPSSCRCGWSTPETSKAARQTAYSAHLTEARAAIAGRCRDCGLELTPAIASAKPGLCRSCSTARTRTWAAENREEYERHHRRSWLKRKYGITPEEYDRLLAEQGGVCGICQQPPADPRGYRMHVDHDHETGAVRGLLCAPCNIGIGNLGDDVERLRAAITYLERTAP